MLPKHITHPTFGKSQLIPNILAIHWKQKHKEKTLQSLLEAHSLKPATQTTKAAEEKIEKTKDTPDPRSTNINQSEILTWATTEHFEKETFEKLNADPDIAWTSPVYRANSAEDDPQSWFTINPTVIIVPQNTEATINEILTLDPSISIDETRTAKLHDLIVINCPNLNALEIGEKLSGKTPAGTFLYENIPYLSPLAHCSDNSCSTSPSGDESSDDCSPSLQPFIPNDTFFPQQWGLERIKAPSAWPLNQGDPNVIIAVLDQGVELTHPDLNLWPISYSTITHTNDGSPIGNHGTPCAGIISAKINNNLGVSGLAGKCSVMAISTFFSDVQVAEGLYYAADNGAQVISMSFGVYPGWMIWNFAIIEAALQYCHDKNLVLVAASGNENIPTSRFPGSDPRTICVGGSNRDDLRKKIGDTSIENWWGACFGSDVDVVAPCLEIPSTDRLGAAGYTLTDYTMRFNGTSSATPHVAALAGLILSEDPTLTNTQVRAIISETCDKISLGTYAYLPTVGKPYGTWNNEVGYGRINAERALLTACSCKEKCENENPCTVDLHQPEKCCVSPCDIPWRPNSQCLFWYETKYFRIPLRKTNDNITNLESLTVAGPYIEFRITYQHKMCLLGKQHGPLLYTVTLLPKETVKLYQSERYRRITSSQQRYSVHTSFMQFLSLVHEARATNKLDILAEQLRTGKSSSSGSSGGGFFGGLFGFGGSSSSSSSTTTTDHTKLSLTSVTEQFNQSIYQASQLTEAERSIVISSYEEKETRETTVRTLENHNHCRAVTYFVRRIIELYAVSSTVSDISWRIISPNIPPEWHSPDDIAWLPQPIQDQIKFYLNLLPKVGQVKQQPKPISLPTDGVVYNPELANCSSCEPEREAEIKIQLEKQKAKSLKECYEAQLLELEIQRRQALLDQGNLAPFEASTSNENDNFSIEEALTEN
jgi:hypothetical protein